MGVSSSIRSMMAHFFVCFLLFSLFCCVLGGGSEQLSLTHSRSCELEQVECQELSDGLLRFFVDRDPVNRGLACDALELLVSCECAVRGQKHGVDWRRFGEECRFFGVRFGSSVDAANDRRISGRKILLEHVRSDVVGNKDRRETQWKDDDGDGRQGNSKESSKGIVVALPAAFLCCLAFLCPCFQKKEKEDTDPLRSGQDSTSSGYLKHSGRMLWSPARVPQSPLRFSGQQYASGSMQFTIQQIQKATENFSESHVIGEGGFGTVYKAELPDGLVVAVKRAKKEHFAFLQAEFKNEIRFLSQIEHQNLVKLLGYIEKEKERIVISEYVSNGTLREHLDGHDGKILDFSHRLSIAIDVAHGLTYLHVYAAEKPIIHRDVKSSNILLTDNLRAKVADFSYAKFGSTGEDETHISTAVKGTAGYIDPEYLLTHKLTPKSDVFSFGALLIEIISGRRPVETKRSADEKITVRWAFTKYTQGKMRDILDPTLEEDVPEDILSSLLELAFRCVASSRNDRPMMQEVQKNLWDIRKEHASFRSTAHSPR